MKIGYACISTVDQNTNSQRDAVNAPSCEMVVIDQPSRVSAKRPKPEKTRAERQACDELDWRRNALKELVAANGANFQ